MKLKNLNIILILFIILIFSNNSYSAIYCSAPAADSNCSDLVCDLQSALAAAEASSADDEINLEQGTYNVPSGVHFTYISSDSGSLIVSGGWNSGCLSQTGDSGTTELVGISPAAATDTFGGVLDISINNASASDLEISNLTVRNGTATDDGGGINIDHFTGGRLNINLNNLQVLNNVAGQEGGGIEIFDWVTNGGIDVNISECLISGNVANTSGPGGIDIIADTTNVADPSTIGITLAGNTVLNNTADSYGGGMYIDPDGSDAIIYNNVIAGNDVTGVTIDASGGGIHFSPFSGGGAIITNNTIADNTATVDGGGIYAFIASNTVSIYNNIVYNNLASLGSDINLFNTNASVICIRNNNFSGLYIDNLLGLKSNVNNLDTSPLYGGGYSLSSGSPMIGRGDNSVAPSIDIDGIARPQGTTVDIGAYEYFINSVGGTVGGINSTCGTGSGSGGGCFIATAAYGSYMHKDVKVLRDFRDEFLLKSRAGKAFVELYYRYSPPVAERIAKSDGLRFIVRVALAPIVFVIKYPLMPAFVLLFGGMILFRRKND